MLAKSPRTASIPLVRSLPQLPDPGPFIREQRRRAHVSLRRLSELAGVSNPYLSQIERGLRRPSARMLRQIIQGMARAMQVSAETLYKQAGLTEEDHPDDVLGAIFRDPGLTDRQRRLLAEHYERLRIETAERRSMRRTRRLQAASGGE